MAKYLYGASIQGIQEYIYATNKLQEIIGASEIIDSLGQKFDEKKDYGEIYAVFDKLRESDLVEQILLNAAGNFRAIVDGEENLKKIVRDLPKKIMQNAYGITISQATAPYKDGDYEKASKELERKLKIQRNRPSLPLDMSINFMALAPKTARAVCKIENKNNKKILLDIASVQKIEARARLLTRQCEKDNNHEEPEQFSDISNKKNKLAVIHADGNGLGVLVKNLTDEVKNTGKLDVIANFSKALDNATKDAYENAIAKTEEVFGKENLKIKALILSGDDMTAVCDADIALEFTKNFIEGFEKETDKKKPDIREKLTMCAGIAYCNEKFPFHHAAALAEELCGAAKKHSKDRYVKDAEKDIAPSCLIFHNVQSSNFQSWDKFIKDELTIGGEKEGRAIGSKKEGGTADGKNASEIRCDFGPYYLGDTTKSKNEPKVENFINLAEMYRSENSPKGKLREWIKELGINDRLAKVMLDRINEVLENRGEFNEVLKALYGGLSCVNLILEKDGAQKTPIYDVLQFLSVTSGAEDKKVEGKNDDKLRA